MPPTVMSDHSERGREGRKFEKKKKNFFFKKFLSPKVTVHPAPSTVGFATIKGGMRENMQ
jgi:hypothetical protein